MGLQLLEPGQLGGGGLVAALCGLGDAGHPVLHHLQIGEDQLGVDAVHVALGIDGHRLGGVLHNVDDVVIVKAAHHMDDGVALPDVAEELVAQTGALTGTLHQTGDVHKFHHGGGLFVGVPHLSQLVQPFVRHRHDAAVGLDGAEGIVGRLSVLGGSNGIEQGALSHVGKAHDT